MRGQKNDDMGIATPVSPFPDPLLTPAPLTHTTLDLKPVFFRFGQLFYLLHSGNESTAANNT